jgi:hypothetical protein
MINETVNLKGDLKVQVIGPDGQEKDRREIPNLVVHVGKVYITERLQSNLNPVMSHMAIGTGNVAAATAQTALVGEAARVGLDSNTITNNTVTYIATFGAGTPNGGDTIAEAGIFNHPTANTGTMLCRTRFNEVNKANADVIVITWNITVQ